MNRTQAIAKLRPILGKRLCWRENPKALVGEEREAARSISVAANAAEDAAKKALYARRAELLENDSEYQRLKLAYQEAHTTSGKAVARAFQHRITVGTNEGMFFHVRARGDNWQEVVNTITKKTAA